MLLHFVLDFQLIRNDLPSSASWVLFFSRSIHDRRSLWEHLNKITHTTPNNLSLKTHWQELLTWCSLQRGSTSLDHQTLWLLMDRHNLWMTYRCGMVAILQSEQLLSLWGMFLLSHSLISRTPKVFQGVQVRARRASDVCLGRILTCSLPVCHCLWGAAGGYPDFWVVMVLSVFPCLHNWCSHNTVELQWAFTTLVTHLVSSTPLAYSVPRLCCPRCGILLMSFLHQPSCLVQDSDILMREWSFWICWRNKLWIFLWQVWLMATHNIQSKKTKLAYRCITSFKTDKMHVCVF